MARRLKSKSNPAGYSESPTLAGWKLTRHAVTSGLLIEFAFDDDVWRRLLASEPVFKPGQEYEALKGCIAKVTPPAGMAETHVLTLENALYGKGARAVRRMPSPPEDRQVTAPAGAQVPSVQRSLRQVVIDRAKRTTTSDPTALVALLDQAMTEAER